MKVMILREKTANTNFYLCRDGTLKIWETELTEFSFQLTEINCNYVPHKTKSTLGQINWVKGSLICLIFLSRWGSVQDSVHIARALEFRTCHTRGNDRSKALLREHPSGVKTEPSLSSALSLTYRHVQVLLKRTKQK